ncbi:PREDICTED: transcription factor SPEECHLESS-like [Ipomoea nil]|uniref:transcription factor SPEECHLESS-like n=1 Tax=Ipomoea nil TaxID=35883 RepID=UPI000901713E|nr:PREDICTED: transcription factor SPEECHLESS-like [Ipomoea nil]
MDNGEILSDFFEDSELAGDDIFSILDALDGASKTTDLLSPKSVSSGAVQESCETAAVAAASPRTCKKRKTTSAAASDGSEDGQQQQPRTSCHITVERNRRKQMNDHLSVLRSLMPAFYVKRGDQASIIEGVVDYINELQQILQSLETKKQRKAYSSEVLSPRILSPSPRKPPLSPRLSLPPISPRTPQPTSPYKPTNPSTSTRLQPPPSLAAAGYLLPAAATTISEPAAASSSSTSAIDSANELAANSTSAIADVEVKFSGSNVILKTVSPRIPGQAVKIISALEDLALEILHVSISTINDDTSLNSYTIKIGIECQLSAEELAQQIQQTFC